MQTISLRRIESAREKRTYRQDWKLSENKREIAFEENPAVDFLADNTCGPSDDSDLARIVFAASKVTTEEEAAAVMDGLRDTEGLTESGIAPDVLSKLLPGDEVVVLPQIKQVAGGRIPIFQACFRHCFVCCCPYSARYTHGYHRYLCED